MARFTFDEDNLTSRERGMINQARQNDLRSTLAADAHERRMARRARFIEGNEGAVSPQERAAVMQWQHNQGLTGRERALQEHERGMLGDKIKGEVDVARQKRLGMENQGVGAAKLRYGFTDHNGEYHEGGEERIARQQGQNALSLAEKEWAGKKEIAEKDAQSRKLGIEAEHGSYDENGNYRPGSRVLSERERGEWSVKQQTEANKGTLAQAEVKRQQQEAQIAATLQRAAIQSQGKIDAAKIGAYSKEISARSRPERRMARTRARCLPNSRRRIRTIPDGSRRLTRLTAANSSKAARRKSRAIATARTESSGFRSTRTVQRAP